MPAKLTRRVRRTAGAAAIALAACAIVASPALSTANFRFTAAQQFKGLFQPMNVKAEDEGFELELRTKGEVDVHVVRNEIGIDGHSGWHTHPGPSLITVTKGTIVAYESTDPLCQPRTYVEGQGFVDDGHHAHLLKNESGAPAETVAVQFLKKGAARRIDAPQPNNCAF